MRCGEPQFEVQDLSSADPSGKGMVSAMELSDVLDKPKLFSTFML
jgi:DNA double-strand break repair helicase HerA and related ATPase